MAQQVKRAGALTADDELARQIEAPDMEAGGSHPQATMMPGPRATSKRLSANEGQTTASAPPETASCASADKGTFALTKGFREARSPSATRNVETRSVVDEALAFYVKATGKDGSDKCS